MKNINYKLLIFLYLICQPAYAHSGRLGLMGEGILIALVLIATIIHFAIIFLMRWKQCFRKKNFFLSAYFMVILNFIIWGAGAIHTIRVFISGDYNGGHLYEFWWLFGELIIILVMLYFIFTIPRKQFSAYFAARRMEETDE